MYSRLVLKSADEEERAAPLLVAPSQAARTVDGRAPSLQDPPTWLLQLTLTITDMHSSMTRQGGTFWYRDCTLTVWKGKAATALQLRLPVPCTDSLAEVPQGHAGHGQTYTSFEIQGSKVCSTICPLPLHHCFGMFQRNHVWKAPTCTFHQSLELPRMVQPVSRFPPNLLTSTAHTYTKHKTNTDACSFTGGRLVCRGSMIHFSMIVSMVFLKCA